MNPSIEVETQGISDDWQHADGDFAVKPRGMLKSDQLKSAMLHLAPLDTPDGDDVCPPQVMTRGPAGSFGFIGQGGSIFCPDTDAELTASQALGMAFGTAPLAPPPPMPASPVAQTAAPRIVTPARQKRKFGWLGGISLFLAICSFLGTVVMIFGVSSMRDRGEPSSDILLATEIGAGFALAAVLLTMLAFKLRRVEHFDAKGIRVKADGSPLPYVAMVQSFGDYDGDDDGADYDLDLD